MVNKQSGTTKMNDPFSEEGFQELRNPVDVDQCKAFSYMSSVEFDMKAIE